MSPSQRHKLSTTSKRKLGIHQTEPTPAPAGSSAPSSNNPRNLPLAKGIPLRDPATPSRLIDLSLAYTTSLTNVAALGAGADALSELPVGIHTFGGVPFDVRGVIFRSSSYEANAALTSIPIRSKCQALYFLHGAAAMVFARDNWQVGAYRVHYAGGGSQDIPVLIGRHVRDWFYYEAEPVEVGQAPLVWVGLNARARHQKLHAPLPNVVDQPRAGHAHRVH